MRTRSRARLRIAHYRRQEIDTRERQIRGVSDNESYGFGVRVLLDGRWGFAASNVMTNAAAQSAALRAIATARAARAVQKRRVELAPVKPVQGTWSCSPTRLTHETPTKGAALFRNQAAAIGSVRR